MLFPVYFESERFLREITNHRIENLTFDTMQSLRDMSRPRNPHDIERLVGWDPRMEYTDGQEFPPESPLFPGLGAAELARAVDALYKQGDREIFTWDTIKSLWEHGWMRTAEQLSEHLCCWIHPKSHTSRNAQNKRLFESYWCEALKLQLPEWHPDRVDGCVFPLPDDFDVTKINAKWWLSLEGPTADNLKLLLKSLEVMARSPAADFGKDLLNPKTMNMNESGAYVARFEIPCWLHLLKLAIRVFGVEELRGGIVRFSR